MSTERHAAKLPEIFRAFAEASPLSVIARGTAERLLNPEHLDSWFEATAEAQYTKSVLFSSLFNIMLRVVSGSHKSVHAAYHAASENIGASVVAVYQKLQGIEPAVAAGLVRYAACEAAATIRALGGELPPLLPGYRVKLLDGNCLATSQRRIKELRGLRAGPLPGKSLVVLDPALRLAIDVFPCEDGHTQERALFDEVLRTVAVGDVWIADRNFCTRGFLTGIVDHGGHYIIREHRGLPIEPVTPEREAGTSETGKVYEQAVAILMTDGSKRTVRRIRVRLKSQTRDGDRDLLILTDLAKDVVAASDVAALYRRRWTIETAFQELATQLRSEIDTLGYPRAALFGFCVALVAHTIMAVLKGALASVHGAQKVQEELSGYYVAEELGATHCGMQIAIPHEEWQLFRDLSERTFVALLITLARAVNMKRFKKNPWRPKVKQPERTDQPSSTHVSTARLLANRKR